jgi:outer membrane protein TolC
VQLSQTYGPVIGIGASWTIFNGNVYRHETENAKINSLISELEYSKIKTQLDQQVETAYDIYQNNLQLQQLENDNQKAAKENLDLSIQKYSIGGISGLDFQNAKQSFVDAQTRHIYLHVQHFALPACVNRANRRIGEISFLQDN